MLTEHVEPEKAKLLYMKLWSLHIDSRALLSQPGTSVEKLEALKAKSKVIVKTKKPIKPGMFFRVKTGDTKENFDIVMAMGVEKSEDSSGRWTCAAVCPAHDMSDGAHELFIAKQVLVKALALTDEMVLEYDSGTRYYYVKHKM